MKPHRTPRKKFSIINRFNRTEVLPIDYPPIKSLNIAAETFNILPACTPTSIGTQ